VEVFCSKSEGFCSYLMRRNAGRWGEKLSVLFRKGKGISNPGKRAFIELLKTEVDIERISKKDLARIFKAILKRLDNFPLPPISAMEIFISEGCNMRCDYCFEPYKRPAKMNVDTGCATIDFLMKESGDNKELSILLFGGEPLIGFDVIKEIVLYAEKQSDIYDKKITFMMTTNGTLFTEESVLFCKEHKIRCMISIDGREETHDRHRKMLDGRGSFKIIEKNLPLIRKYLPDFSVRMTPLPDTVGSLYDDVRYLVEEVGTRDITLGGATGVRWMEEDYAIYEDEMKKIISFWKESDRSFRISFLEQAGTTKWGCQAGRYSICITSEGNIIPCARVFGVEELERSYTFGNVHVGWKNTLARKELLAVNSMRSQICYECAYRGFCGGGCFVCNFREVGNLVVPSPRECLEVRAQFHAREIGGISTIPRRFGKVIRYDPYGEPARPLLLSNPNSVPVRCEDLISKVDENGELSLYHIGRPNIYKTGSIVEKILSRIDGRSSVQQIVEDMEDIGRSVIGWLSHNHFIRLVRSGEARRKDETSPQPLDFHRPILWESFITLSSSMGIVSHENILSIDRLGYPIYIHSWNDPSQDQFGRPAVEPLDRRVMELLEISKDLPSRLEDEGIAISFGSTSFLRFDRWKRAYKRIIYCFLDQTAISKTSVEILNLLDHVFVPSSFCRDNLIKCGVKTPITIWHHGVNPDLFPYIERKRKSPYIFLFVGVAQERKGIEELLVAFIKEFSKGEDVRLIVKSADWGDVDEWRDRFKDKRIIWHWANVSRKNMANYYFSADCLVIPSRGDSFCLPVLEAMATGLPVIVHDWGGIKDYCNESNSYLVRNAGRVPAVGEEEGELYPYMPEWGLPDVDHLRYLMRYVYEHWDEAMEKGRKAAEMVAREWTWSHKAKEIIDLISSWKS
jgi:uncharacterized protein